MKEITINITKIASVVYLLCWFFSMIDRDAQLYHCLTKWAKLTWITLLLGSGVVAIVGLATLILM